MLEGSLRGPCVIYIHPSCLHDLHTLHRLTCLYYSTVRYHVHTVYAIAFMLLASCFSYRVNERADKDKKNLRDTIRAGSPVLSQVQSRSPEQTTHQHSTLR